MEKRYTTIKVTGREDHLTKFIQLCKTLKYLGSVGSTRTIKVWFDGDGAARLNFDYGDTDVSNVEIPNINDPIEISFE